MLIHMNDETDKRLKVLNADLMEIIYQLMLNATAGVTTKRLFELECQLKKMLDDTTSMKKYVTSIESDSAEREVEKNPYDLETKEDEDEFNLAMTFNEIPTKFL